MSVVRLTTCNDIYESHQIQDLLEAEGIECFATNEHITTLMPIYNGMLGAGIQIMVDETDLDKATALLKSIAQNGTLVCPFCGSENIGFGLGSEKRNKIVQIVISLLLLIPLGRESYTHYCKDCNKDFKS